MNRPHSNHRKQAGKETARQSLVLAEARRLVRQYQVPLRSICIFVALVGLWLVFYSRILDSSVFNWFMKLVSGLVGYVLYLTGSPVTVRDTLVYSPAFSMEIGNECTGIVPMILLISAVFSYQSSLAKKLICLALGLPFIFLLNLIRLVSLYYIGIYLSQYFNIAHFVAWQSLIILAVISIWLFWARKVTNAQSS